MQTEYAVDGPVKAIVNLDKGSIAVYAEDRDSVLVSVAAGTPTAAMRKAADQTRIDFTGHTIEVTQPERRAGLFQRRIALDIVLRVPAGGTVEVNVVSADVQLAGRSRKVAVNTVSSEVAIAVPPGTSVSVESNKLTGQVQIDDDVRHVVVGADQQIEVNALRGKVNVLTMAA